MRILIGTRQVSSLNQPAPRVFGFGEHCLRAGFSYQLDFDDGPRDDDRVLEYDGVRVLVDPTSAEYLAETEIDFVSSLHGGGFKFTKVCDTCGEVVPYGKIFCPKCEKYIESDKAYSEQRKNLQLKTRR